MNRLMERVGYESMHFCNFPLLVLKGNYERVISYTR